MDAPIASSAQSPSTDQRATGSATDAAEATAKDRQVEASKKRTSPNGPPQPVKKTKHIALSTENRKVQYLSLWRATILASANIRAGARDLSGGTMLYQTCVTRLAFVAGRHAGGGQSAKPVAEFFNLGFTSYLTSSDFVGIISKKRVIFGQP